MNTVKERDDVLCAENEAKLRDKLLSVQQEDLFMKKILCEEIWRQKMLSEEKKSKLREEILEEYEEIDYRISDAANIEHFANLEKKLEILRASELYHSKKKDSIYSTLRRIEGLLRHLQRNLYAQIRRINQYDDWTKLSETEDEIVASLIEIIDTFLSIKICCFEHDEELEKISTHTFSHKFLRFLCLPEKSNMLMEKTIRRNHFNKSIFLSLIYYSKSWEDKAEYQKAILKDYYERCKDSDQVYENNVAVQRQLIKDFQGDLALIVKEKRKQRKWTQQKLASVSGVERTMIAKVENLQASTSLETAIKLLTPLDLGLVIYPFDSARFVPDYEPNQSEKENFKTEIEGIV